MVPAILLQALINARYTSLTNSGDAECRGEIGLRSLSKNTTA